MCVAVRVVCMTVIVGEKHFIVVSMRPKPGTSRCRILLFYVFTNTHTLKTSVYGNVKNDLHFDGDSDCFIHK